MSLARVFRDDPFFGPVPHLFEDPFPSAFSALGLPVHPGQQQLGHPANRAALLPPMQIDIKETEQEYRVHADLPGLNKDDIDISFDQGVLKISAERKEEKKEENEKFHVSERRYGRVSRSIRLPRDVDESRINASYDAGVLDVVVPKVQRGANGQTRIKVQ